MQTNEEQSYLKKFSRTLKALYLYPALYPALRLQNDRLSKQNKALKEEVRRMVRSAMHKHWENVKDLQFNLEEPIHQKTYLVTISPNAAKLSLNLPVRTNFALFFRNAFMWLLPQSAFSQLVTEDNFKESTEKHIRNLLDP